MLTKSLKQKINACERKALRKIEEVRKQDKIRSATIRNKLNVNCVLEKNRTSTVKVIRTHI